MHVAEAPEQIQAVDGAWGQLVRVMLDLWPQFVAACAVHDLPPAQGHALLRMVDRRAMKMRDLAELLTLDPSTVTGVVDRMEARGLVRRVTGPDRRAKLLEPTAHGLELRAELLRTLNRTPGPIERLPRAQREQIAAALALVGAGPCLTFPAVA